MRGLTQGAWIRDYDSGGRLEEDFYALSSGGAILELYDKMGFEVAGLTQLLSQLLATGPPKKS
jgi:hypothetical protein